MERKIGDIKDKKLKAENITLAAINNPKLFCVRYLFKLNTLKHIPITNHISLARIYEVNYVNQGFVVSA